MRILFQMYHLPDPLTLLEGPLWPKQRWKRHVDAVITSYYEKQLRERALSNYKLEFLNIQASGLSGRSHPILSWFMTTEDVVRSRIHVKMLAGDYLCYDHLSQDRGGDPQCRLCQAFCSTPAPAENMIHLLTRCPVTANPRTRILPDLLNTIATYFHSNKILENQTLPC